MKRNLMCTEFWKIKDGTESINTLYCNGQNPSLRLDVDGEFVYTDDIAPFLFQITGQRSSIVMEIGKCARIPH